MVTSAGLPNVLLVEDDEVDVENVQRAFDKLFERVRLNIANDGLEALEKLYGLGKEIALSPIPELIILDLNMPKMNGIEFLRILRADHQFDEVKVLVITTSDHVQDRSDVISLNIYGYLVKPITSEQLMLYCEKILKS